MEQDIKVGGRGRKCSSRLYSMRKSRTIIIAGSVFTAASTMIIAVGLALLLPGATGSKQLAIAILCAISPLPFATVVMADRAMKRYEGATAQLATRDALTNLFNQSTFWELLTYETDRCRRQKYRFSLMAIDLDNFKAINDRFGHEIGDSFLCEFSALFKAAIRKGDIAARYGGDNFAAILPVCDEAQAHIAARRLLDSLRERSLMLPDGTAIRITASIGIAVFPDHARDARDLYLLADSMLYQAKTAGKDRFSVPSDDVNLDELRSAGEKSILIMEALRSKRIIPYFQPIIDVKGRKVLAYEVLTRIVTPERVIPAAEFITEAEGMGAIGKIDTLLIERAFALVKQENYRGQLFFNLSPKAMVLSDFLSTIRQLLKDYDVMPSQIVFEITERDTVKNLEILQRNVRLLKQEGFRFAIDDFGSGYSSFRYITAFPVDFLKVDGEFIRNMTSANQTEHAIVSNIASFARNLGIKTIAEYVESAAILDNVRSAGLDYAQGYYIERPSPHLSVLHRPEIAQRQ